MNADMQTYLVRKIALHYGFDHQLKKAMEELGECLTAAARLALCNTEKRRSEFFSEVADVQIMLEQLVFLSNADRKVGEIRKAKIERQKQRMQKEAI